MNLLNIVSCNLERTYYIETNFNAGVFVRWSRTLVLDVKINIAKML